MTRFVKVIGLAVTIVFLLALPLEASGVNLVQPNGEALKISSTSPPLEGLILRPFELGNFIYQWDLPPIEKITYLDNTTCKVLENRKQLEISI
jgi:hypothetical protein